MSYTIEIVVPAVPAEDALAWQFAESLRGTGRAAGCGPGCAVLAQGRSGWRPGRHAQPRARLVFREAREAGLRRGSDLAAASGRGDPDSQYLFGCMFSRGEGLPQDLRQAFALLREAASGGHADAQYELAQMYFHSEDEPSMDDRRQALHWLKAAAAQGHDQAIAIMSEARLGKR